MTKTKIGIRKRIGATVLSACAYAATMSGLGGLDDAGAVTLRELPSSICHQATDNVGSTLNNSGALTYTGTDTKSIFCPVVSDSAQFAPDVTAIAVHGVEGVNGAISRACSCYLDPGVACFCSTGMNWSNNNNPGVVVPNLSSAEWANSNEVEFRYLFHTMTQNSSLAGMVLVGN